MVGIPIILKRCPLFDARKEKIESELHMDSATKVSYAVLEYGKVCSNGKLLGEIQRG
jgi:hypothetical protein